MLNISTGSAGRSRRRSRRRSMPVRPGSVMSRTTRSQSASRTRASASSALPASPPTTMSSVSARICFRPSRTIGWSSTIRIFFMPGLLCDQGDPDAKSGTAARGARNFDGSPERLNALADPEKSERRLSAPVFLLDSLAVVGDLEKQIPCLPEQLDLHPGRPSVPDDVGEGLLDYSEEVRRAVRIDRHPVQTGPDPARDPGPRLELPGLPFDRLHEAEVIENYGPELGREIPHRPKQPVDRLPDGARRRTKGLGLAGQRLPEPRDRHFQDRELLSELVMDLA